MKNIKAIIIPNYKRHLKEPVSLNISDENIIKELQENIRASDVRTISGKETKEEAQKKLEFKNDSSKKNESSTTLSISSNNSQTENNNSANQSSTAINQTQSTQNVAKENNLFDLILIDKNDTEEIKDIDLNKFKVIKILINEFMDHIKQPLLCVRLSLLQNALKEENNEKVFNLINLLATKFRFKLIVDSGDTRRRQNTIIDSFNNALNIDAQIILKHIGEFNQKKYHNRMVYEIDIKEIKNRLCKVFEVEKSSLYCIFGQPNHVLMYNDGNQQSYQTIFECLLWIYKKYVDLKKEPYHKMISAVTQQLSIQPQNKFTYLRTEPNVAGNSAIIKIFKHNDTQQEYRNFLNHKIVSKDQECYNLSQYKELLGLKLYSIFGVFVPQTYLSEQILNKSSAEMSTSKNTITSTHLMIECQSQFQQLEETFLSNYKNSKSDYYYYPNSIMDGPLIGFGFALMAAYLLNDMNLIKNNRNYFGFIKRNGYNEIAISRAEKMFGNWKIEEDIFQNRENTNFVILSADEQNISFEELHENEKWEFIMAAQILNESNNVAEPVWDKFMHTQFKNEFTQLKNLYDNRKTKITHEISKIEYIKLSQNFDSSILHQGIEKNIDPSNQKLPNEKTLCLNMSPIQHVFTTEKSQSMSYIMKFLKKECKFQKIVNSQKQTEKKQDKIIEEFQSNIPLDGQMILSEDEKFITNQKWDPSKKRYVIQIYGFPEKWCSELEITEQNLFCVFGDGDSVSLERGEEKLLQDKNIFRISCYLFEKHVQSSEASTEYSYHQLTKKKIPGFTSFRKNFWVDYKNNNVNYFYYPPIRNSYPLIGFGAALAVMSILNDLSCLNYNSNNIGYVVRNDCLIFAKFYDNIEFLNYENNQINENKPKENLKNLILSNGEEHIYFEDLCEYDQFEFALTINNLKCSEDEKNNTWNQFKKTMDNEIVDLLKKQWSARKKEFLKNFDDVIKIRLDVDEYDQSMVKIKKNVEKFFTRTERFKVEETEKLGGGRFGCVYKGCLANNQNKIIAVKRINEKRDYLTNKGLIDAGITTKTGVGKLEYDREIEALSMLKTIQSPHLPEYYGAQLLENNDRKFMLELGMELCDGDLNKYLHQKKLTDEECFNIFWQVVEGLDMLHTNKIIHRDLKPENILYKKICQFNAKHNNDLTIWKIGDFGLATMKMENNEPAGTPLYMAPEIKMQKGYGKPVDIWALGLILHKLIFKSDYYHKGNLDCEYVLEKEQEEKINSKIKELLNGMMQKDPKKRFTIKKVKKYQQGLYFNSDLMETINKYDEQEQIKKKTETKSLQENIQNDTEAEKMIENGEKWMSKGFFIKAKLMLLQVEKYCDNSINHKICVADVYDNIAECYKNTYNYQNAFKYYEKWLSLCLKQDGICDLQIAQLYELMGDQLTLLGKREEALYFYKQYISIYVARFGEESIEMAHIYRKTGNKLKSFHDCNESTKYFEKSLKVKISHLKEMHKKQSNQKHYEEKNIQKTQKSQKAENQAQSFDKNIEESTELAELNYQMAIDCRSNNNYDKAYDYYLEWLKIYEKVFQSNKIKLADKYQQMGNQTREIKKYKEAFEYYKKWFDIYKTEYENDDLKLASIYQKMGNQLGSLYIKNDEAEKYYVLWFDIYKTKHIQDNIKLSSIYKEMGDQLRQIKKYEKAFDYYTKWLENEDGKNKIEAANVYQNMGDKFQFLEKYKEALNCYMQWFNIIIEGSKIKTEKAEIYKKMGDQLQQINENKEALRYYQDWLNIYENEYKDNFKELSRIYEIMGDQYLSINMQNEAFKYYNKCLLECTKDLNKSSINYAKYHEMMGDKISSLSNPQEALKNYEIALKIYNKNMNPEVGYIYKKIGDQYFFLKNYFKAFKSYENWLDECYKSDCIERGCIYETMGDKNQSAQLCNYNEVLKYYNESLKIFENCEEKTLQADIYEKIANYYQLQKDYINAINNYQLCLKIILKHYGENSAKEADIYEKMGNLYQSQKDDNDAKKYYGKWLEIYEKNFGKDNIEVAEKYEKMGDKYLSFKIYEEALNYYNKCLKIIERRYQQESTVEANIYKKIGTLHQSKGNNVEAKTFYENWLKIYQKIYEGNPAGLKNIYNEMAKMLECLCDTKDAELYKEKASKIEVAAEAEAEAKKIMQKNKILHDYTDPLEQLDPYGKANCNENEFPNNTSNNGINKDQAEDVNQRRQDQNSPQYEHEGTMQNRNSSQNIHEETKEKVNDLPNLTQQNSEFSIESVNLLESIGDLLQSAGENEQAINCYLHCLLIKVILHKQNVDTVSDLQEKINRLTNILQLRNQNNSLFRKNQNFGKIQWTEKINKLQNYSFLKKANHLLKYFVKFYENNVHTVQFSLNNCIKMLENRNSLFGKIFFSFIPFKIKNFNSFKKLNDAQKPTKIWIRSGLNLIMFSQLIIFFKNQQKTQVQSSIFLSHIQQLTHKLKYTQIVTIQYAQILKLIGFQIEISILINGQYSIQNRQKKKILTEQIDAGQF